MRHGGAAGEQSTGGEGEWPERALLFPSCDWRNTLTTGDAFVIPSPNVVRLRGLATFVIVLALNLVDDALRDLLDP